jgi:hypothetical protein
MILAKQPVYCAIRQFLAPRMATVEMARSGKWGLWRSN